MLLLALFGIDLICPHLLLNCWLRSLQVFSCSSTAKLIGLFAVSDRPNRPLTVTTEQTDSPFAIRVNVLRRNATEHLALVQTVPLQESASNLATFATGADGSVLCAIWNSSAVHEMCRTPGAANAPFGADANTHSLPSAIRFICGFECDGERRVAASFEDNTLRVFRARGDGLCELQQIRAPHDNWSPRSLVGLADGAFCVSSYFIDPADSEWKYAIELCAADASGALSSPRLLMQFTNVVELWCNSRPADASDGATRIIAVEYSLSGNSLRVFTLNEG